MPEPAPAGGPSLDDRPRQVAPAAVFLAVALAVFLLALDGGGYDIVVRQRAALVLWWLLALAVLAGIVPRTRPSRSGTLVLVALVLLTAWTAASLAWTSSDERTLTEIARTGAHLGVVALLATALGPRTWRAALAGATVAAVGICVVALGGRLSPGAFGTDYVSQAFGSAKRLEQPFGYWNAVGAWASMTAVLCLGWSAHPRRVVRAGALAAVPLAVAVVYLTYSRAAIIDGALGLAVLIAVSRSRWTLLLHASAGVAGSLGVVLAIRHAPAIADGTGGHGAGAVLLVLILVAAVLALAAWLTGAVGLDRRRLPQRTGRVVWVIGPALIVAALVLGSVTVAPSVWHSFTKRDQATQSTDPAARLSNLNGSRNLIWQAALHEFEQHPLDGSGAGTFEFTWNLHGTEGEFIRNGHSLYLESMADLGVPGLAWIVLFLVGVLATLVRALGRIDEPRGRAALAAAGAALATYFVGAGVDWLWESTAVTMLALGLIGAAIAATGRPSAPLRLAWRIPLTVLAILLCALQLPGLVSTSEVRRSETAYAHGDLTSALAHADQAISTEPWAATPLVQRALIEEQEGRLSAAQSDLDQARAREPLNWRIPLIRARVDARAGLIADALADYRRARSLRPRGAFFSG